MGRKADGRRGGSETKGNTAQQMASDLLKTDGTQAHTGELIPEEKRRKVLELLANGGGINETAEQVGINKRTLMAIREAEIEQNPSFATRYYATRTPARLLHLANRSLERMTAEIDSLPAGVLPVVMGVALDKYLSMTGQASTISEVRHSVSLGDASGPAGVSGAGKVIDV